jgi:hypothetical protein
MNVRIRPRQSYMNAVGQDDICARMHSHADFERTTRSASYLRGRYFPVVQVKMLGLKDQRIGHAGIMRWRLHRRNLHEIPFFVTIETTVQHIRFFLLKKHDKVNEDRLGTFDMEDQNS